ncbi:hypothetical protein KMZ14_12845 [Acinetobacter schindleri]|uniref:hypothetical protein n=1 Tax=Acinetobacter schindleri TaxID=108981 RepID=UPI0015D44A3D|nr:hypothetical protein [Acinetobacter schindleri]WDE15599.1 hypothetical protein KMZ14_12845 [Acinetobacter schindleri]
MTATKIQTQNQSKKRFYTIHQMLKIDQITTISKIITIDLLHKSKNDRYFIFKWILKAPSPSGMRSITSQEEKGDFLDITFSLRSSATHLLQRGEFHFND